MTPRITNLALACLLAASCTPFIALPQSVAYANGHMAGQVLKVDTTSTSKDYLAVKQYAINASLDDSDDRLRMTVTVKVKNNTSRSFSSLYFRNPAYTMISQVKSEYPANASCKAKISSIRNLSAKRNLKFSADQNDRSIVKANLGNSRLKPGATVRIRLVMRVDIPKTDGRFGYSINSRGSLYYLSFCYPQLADYRAGSWSLSPFPEEGENRFARTTNYSVTFKARKAYKIASTGTSKTRKGVTKVDARHVRDFALVACDYMKKDVAKVDGVKIVNWYLPGGIREAEYRKTTMTALKDAVAYLSAHVGPSPFPEIDVVQAFGGTSNSGWVDMEHSALITLAGDRYYYWWGATEGSNETLAGTTYHEMAHQWFYAAVGNDEYNEPWLDEGLAAYCNKWAMWKGITNTSQLLAEEKGVPVDDYIAARRASFREVIEQAETRTGTAKITGSVPSYANYFSTVYNTSVWFLVQLEEQVGQSTFDSILSDYYRTYRLKEATTQGFLDIVRKHAMGSETNALIAKYFPEG